MGSEIKKYTAAVRRRLNLPKELKDRCQSDLLTTINLRMEAGESWSEIKASLGTADKVAADLNEQMKDYAYRKSPWRFVFLAAAVLSGAWLAFYGVLQLLVWYIMNPPGAASVGIIGGADGPTAIFLTSSGGADWDLIIMGVVLITGILGFLRLRRCKAKK